MPMYYLIECRDDYLKSLWQFEKYELSLDNNDNVANFTDANRNGKSLKYKKKHTSLAGDNGKKLLK